MIKNKTPFICLLAIFLTPNFVFAAESAAAIAEFTQAHYETAKTLFDGNLKTARAEKNTALENESLYYLGRIYFELGEFETAKDNLDKSVAIEPNSSDEYYWLGRAYGVLAQRASVFKQISYASSTHKYFQLAVEADAKNIQAQRGLCEFLIVAPAMMGGSLEKAEASIAAIRVVSPVDADIEELQLLGKKEQPLLLVEKAKALIANYPNNAEAQFRGGMTLRNQKDIPSAIAALSTASKTSITPQNRSIVESAMYNYADTSSRIGEHTEDAIATLEKLLATKADVKTYNRNWPLWVLAKLYRQKGDEQKFASLRSQLDENFIKANKALRDDLEKHAKD